MRISRPVRRPAPASMPSKPIRDIGTGNLPFRPKDIASTMQGTNSSVGTPTGTRGTLVNDAFGGPTSGPGAPISQPGLTGGASSIPAGGASYGTPAGGNIGAPATSTFQGGTSGGSGMAGGMPNTSMPNTSMPPAGAAFKRGGAVKAKKMASGGMTSKAATASKRGDGIAQRGKTKGRMV